MKYVSKILSNSVFLLCCILISLVSSSRAAYADVTLKDVQTLIRTIGFLENRAADPAFLAIIYSPDIKNSLQEAQQMQQHLHNSKSSLSARMVPVTALEQVQNVQYAFVAGDMQKYYKRIDAKLRENKILSFTLQRSCIDDNCCAVYINAKNRVEIIINKSVTDAVQAKFKPVFLLMITVI